MIEYNALVVLLPPPQLAIAKTYLFISKIRFQVTQTL